jgi:hypothetical protein
MEAARAMARVVLPSAAQTVGRLAGDVLVPAGELVAVPGQVQGVGDVRSVLGGDHVLALEGWAYSPAGSPAISGLALQSALSGSEDTSLGAGPARVLAGLDSVGPACRRWLALAVWFGDGEGAELGEHGGGLCRAYSLEYLVCLPQQGSGLRGLVGGDGAAGQAGR